MGSLEVSPSPSRHSVGEERGGATRASAFAGASDSADSSLPGVGVAGSSRSQESPVLADPSPVDSSVSTGWRVYWGPLPLFRFISLMRSRFS